MKFDGTLADIISKKIENQTLLKSKGQQLEELDIELVGSKFSRWFGSSYLSLKWFLTLIIGIILLAVGIILILKPALILSNEDLKKELISNSKRHYAELAGNTLEQSLIMLMENSSTITSGQVANNLEEAFDRAIEEDLNDTFQSAGILIIILALFSFYVSRLTRKMKVRNKKISIAETTSQQIIEEYKQSVELGENELVLLQEYARSLSAGKQNIQDKSTPPTSVPKTDQESKKSPS